jgi:hypothetical protein
MEEDLPEWMKCPITGEIMTDPVIMDCDCKYTCSREAFVKWVIEQEKTTCPLRCKLRSSDASPNMTARDAVEYFLNDLGRTGSRPRNNDSTDENVFVRKVVALSSASDHHAAAKLLAELKTLAHANDDNKRNIADVGGIACVTNSMEQHYDHSRVQNHACRVLMELALVADNQILIRQAGGISMVISVMRRHKNNAKVQEQGCGALRTLAYKNPHNIVSIVDEGGVYSVTNAMQKRLSNATVQQQGCGALGNFAYKNAESKIEVEEAGGIACVVKAMQYHTFHVGVQEYGCWALRSLASSSSMCRILSKNDSISVLETAMRIFPTNANIHKWAPAAVRKIRQKEA